MYLAKKIKENSPAGVETASSSSEDGMMEEAG
jgi:hypothetical protein